MNFIFGFHLYSVIGIALSAIALALGIFMILKPIQPIGRQKSLGRLLSIFAITAITCILARGF